MSSFILTFVALISIAGDFNHYPAYSAFSIEKNEAVWTQIFEHDSAHYYEPDQVFKQLKTQAWLENVRWEGKEIWADLHDFQVDHKKYNAKYIKTSTIIRTGSWNGKVRVAFKDGRYRVLVYGLHYVAMQPEVNAGKVTIEAHEIFGTLTEWALNDSRTSYKKAVFYNLDLLHLGLKEVFTINTFETKEENW